MDRSIRIARELVKLAKSLVALDVAGKTFKFEVRGTDETKPVTRIENDTTGYPYGSFGKDDPYSFPHEFDVDVDVPNDIANYINMAATNEDLLREYFSNHKDAFIYAIVPLLNGMYDGGFTRKQFDNTCRVKEFGVDVNESSKTLTVHIQFDQLSYDKRPPINTPQSYTKFDLYYDLIDWRTVDAVLNTARENGFVETY